ncbi:MAG: cell division topological specificity factor [Fusobacteriaceae bacterium]|nr:minE [Fusobacteriales bacterium]MDN5303518.1 cell division topological specificity factor [Fusobacteriaceae bacterium]
MLSMFKKSKNSASVASNRLKVVITQDRASISQEVMDDLKKDMIKVFQKYLVIEENGLECNVQREREKNIGLSITIPIKKVKRRGNIFDED